MTSRTGIVLLRPSSAAAGRKQKASPFAVVAGGWLYSTLIANSDSFAQHLDAAAVARRGLGTFVEVLLARSRPNESHSSFCRFSSSFLLLSSFAFLQQQTSLLPFS